MSRSPKGVDLTPEYLKPGFDVSKLKAAELRSALNAEDIDFNMGAKKPELVETFKKQIEGNAAVSSMTTTTFPCSPPLASSRVASDFIWG